MDDQFPDRPDNETASEISGPRQRIAAYIAAHAAELARRTDSGIEDDGAPAVDILPPQQKLVLPEGDAAQILERQLACSAAMIAEVARSLVEESHPVGMYAELMKSTSVLVGASALAARVTAELRSGGATCSKTNGV